MQRMLLDKTKRFLLIKSCHDLNSMDSVRKLTHNYEYQGEIYADFEDLHGKIYSISVSSTRENFEDLTADEMLSLWKKATPDDFEKELKGKRIFRSTLESMIQKIKSDPLYRYIDLKKVEEAVIHNRFWLSDMIMNPDICVMAKKDGYMNGNDYDRPFCKKGDYYRVVHCTSYENGMSLGIATLNGKNDSWTSKGEFHNYFELVNMPYFDKIRSLKKIGQVN